MANAQQPFVSNPLSSFDPSQWSNAYSSFNSPGQIPAWPTQYRGTPTDAFGNPISSFDAAQQAAAAQLAASTTPPPATPTPGTTLNSPGQSWALMTPQQRVAATNAANPDPANAAFANAWFNTRGSQPSNPFISDRVQPAQATAAAAPAAAPSGFNSYQSALDALSNPGPLKQYGAVAPPTQPSSGVLQNFLANWQPGSSGPGSGFTQGFSKALRGK